MLPATDTLQSPARLRSGEVREWGARIRKLRSDVWRGEGVDVPPSVIWDRYDDTAHHWILFEGADLLGAARLCLANSISDLPDSSVYDGMPIAVAPPIALISRLVIHPAARGRGHSRAFDAARINCARELGAFAILVHVFPHRMAQLMRAGWSLIGEVGQPVFVDDGRKQFVLSLTLR